MFYPLNYGDIKEFVFTYKFLQIHIPKNNQITYMSNTLVLPVGIEPTFSL